MNSEEIRKNFLSFFQKKGHAIVPSSSLAPDDPSVLLTTAGMQQFKRYFTGELDAEKDFGSKRTVSIQKCFRATDIDIIGDKTHLTFFEMLGNFSFNDYWKREAIFLAYEFITEILGISPDRISISVFAGDQDIPFDKESFDIWRDEIGLPVSKIVKQGRKDNFWGPTGDEGPCGPTSEIYVDGIEIWNLVFNEYYQEKIPDSNPSAGGQIPNSRLRKLENPGVDTGMGLERLTAVMRGVEDVFQTDIFRPLIERINELAPALNDRMARILADHCRAIFFLVADGVKPSNKEAGYILRRLLRRVLAYQIKYDIHSDIFLGIAGVLKDKFKDIYPEIKEVKKILDVLEGERIRFQQVIAKGLSRLKNYPKITAKEAFYLYETFGLPFELTKEMAAAEAIQDLKREDFEKEFEKHQEISRAGAAKKFGGHGLVFDTGEIKAQDEKELEKIVRLHTATHLLQQALRDILGSEVRQMGSDITGERTRFDFSFGRKLTPEEIKKVEDLINQKIQEDLPVGFMEMSKSEAEKIGALHFFRQKYPETVKVYYVGHSLDKAYSKEFCGGPHVDHTLIIGRFKILKEESVGAGIRRIKATVEY